MAQNASVDIIKISRVPSTGNDESNSITGVMDTNTIWGLIDNFVEPVINHDETLKFGRIGAVSEWNHTATISDMTFDIYEANQNPHVLGPSDQVFEVWEHLSMVDGEEKVQKWQFEGYIKSPRTRTWTRGDTGNVAGTITIGMHKIIKGGGENLDVLTKEGSDLYLDLREGEYLTRDKAGGTQTDWFAYLKIANESG